MLRKPTGYDDAKRYTESEILPAGSYVCEIKNARVEGNCLLIAVEIFEGDYKGFFERQFNNNQNDDRKWKGVFRLWLPSDSDDAERYERNLRRCKTEFGRIEDSNEGFVWEWDERTLKGKLVGVVFRHTEWEYNARRGFRAEAFRLATVDDVRNGKIKLPDVKYLNASSSRAFAPVVVDSNDEDLPF